jgi:hypothetical protein
MSRLLTHFLPSSQHILFPCLVYFLVLLIQMISCLPCCTDCSKILEPEVTVTCIWEANVMRLLGHVEKYLPYEILVENVNGFF